MLKKIFSVLLSLLLVMSLCAAAPAQKAETLQDKINAMKLEPMRKTWPFADGVGKVLIKRVDTIVKGKATNYDKLLAVYIDVVNDADLNAMRKKTNNCTAYASTLYEKLVILGFKPYALQGNITTVSGGWTMHSWTGLDIDGTLYFLDALMSASGGKDYFLKPQKSATMYDIKNTEIWQLDVGTYLVANSVALTKADTAAKRKKYAPVLDMYRETDFLYRTFGDEFKKGGIYENDEYFVTGDKRGNVISVYRDGKMVVETKAEYDARTNREFQERDKQDARNQWNANKDYVDKFGTYDEVFDENGNLRNPDKYKKAS